MKTHTKEALATEIRVGIRMMRDGWQAVVEMDLDDGTTEKMASESLPTVEAAIARAHKMSASLLLKEAIAEIPKGDA